jgi:hypothetical protein
MIDSYEDMEGRLSKIGKIVQNNHTESQCHAKNFSTKNDTRKFVESVFKISHVESLIMGEIVNLLNDDNRREMASIIKTMFDTHQVQIRNAIYNFYEKLDATPHSMVSSKFDRSVAHLLPQSSLLATPKIETTVPFDTRPSQKVLFKEELKSFTSKVNGNQDDVKSFIDGNPYIISKFSRYSHQTYNFEQSKIVISSKDGGQRSIVQTGFTAEEMFEKEADRLCKELEAGKINKIDGIKDPLLLIRVNEKLTYRILESQHKSQRKLSKLLERLSKVGYEKEGSKEIEDMLSRIIERYSQVGDDVFHLKFDIENIVKQRMDFKQLDEILKSKFENGYRVIFRKLFDLIAEFRRLASSSKYTETEFTMANIDEERDNNENKMKQLEDSIRYLTGQCMSFEATATQFKERFTHLEEEREILLSSLKNFQLEMQNQSEMLVKQSSELKKNEDMILYMQTELSKTKKLFRLSGQKLFETRQQIQRLSNNSDINDQSELSSNRKEISMEGNDIKYFTNQLRHTMNLVHAASHEIAPQSSVKELDEFLMKEFGDDNYAGDDGSASLKNPGGILKHQAPPKSREDFQLSLRKQIERVNTRDPKVILKQLSSLQLGSDELSARKIESPKSKLQTPLSNSDQRKSLAFTGTNNLNSKENPGVSLTPKQDNSRMSKFMNPPVDIGENLNESRSNTTSKHPSDELLDGHASQNRTATMNDFLSKGNQDQAPKGQQNSISYRSNKGGFRNSKPNPELGKNIEELRPMIVSSNQLDNFQVKAGGSKKRLSITQPKTIPKTKFAPNVNEGRNVIDENSQGNKGREPTVIIDKMPYIGSKRTVGIQTVEFRNFKITSNMPTIIDLNNNKIMNPEMEEADQKVSSTNLRRQISLDEDIQKNYPKSKAEFPPNLRPMLFSRVNLNSKAEFDSNDNKNLINRITDLIQVKSYTNFGDFSKSMGSTKNIAYEIAEVFLKPKLNGKKNDLAGKAFLEMLEQRATGKPKNIETIVPNFKKGKSGQCMDLINEEMSSIQNLDNAEAGLGCFDPALCKLIDNMDPDEARQLMVELKKKLASGATQSETRKKEDKVKNWRFAPASKVKTKSEKQKAKNMAEKKNGSEEAIEVHWEEDEEDSFDDNSNTTEKLSFGNNDTSSKNEITEVWNMPQTKEFKGIQPSLKSKEEIKSLTKNIKNNSKMNLEFSRNTNKENESTLQLELASRSLKIHQSPQDSKSNYRKSEIFKSRRNTNSNNFVFPQMVSPKMSKSTKKKEIENQIKHIADNDLKKLHQLIYMTSGEDQVPEKSHRRSGEKWPSHREIDAKSNSRANYYRNTSTTNFREGHEQKQIQIAENLENKLSHLMEIKQLTVELEADPFYTKVKHIINQFAEHHSVCFPVCKHLERFEQHLKLFVQKKMERQPMKLPIIKFDKVEFPEQRESFVSKLTVKHVHQN